MFQRKVIVTLAEGRGEKRKAAKQKKNGCAATEKVKSLQTKMRWFSFFFWVFFFFAGTVSS